MDQILKSCEFIFKKIFQIFLASLIALIGGIISLGIYAFSFKDELISKRASLITSRPSNITKDIMIPLFNIDEPGGIYTYADILIQNLIKKRPNYRFIIACNSDLNYKFAKKFEKYPNTLIVKTEYGISDISCIFLGLTTISPKINRFINKWIANQSDDFNDIFYRFKQKLFFGKIFVDKYVDLIFSVSFGISVNLGIKQVSILHDLYFLDMPNTVKGNIVEYYKDYFDVSAKLISISDFVKDSINRHFTIPSYRLITIPNQFSKRFPEVYSDKEILNKFNLLPKKYFVYTSSFWRHKNHLGLIEAFDLFLKKRNIPQNFKLVLLGQFEKDPKSPMISAQIAYKAMSLTKKLHLEKQIIFTGFIKDEEVASIMKNATALVCASLYEGFGMPLAEAMQLKTPVISSFQGSLREIGFDAALFFNPFDKNDIADTMYTVFNSQKLQETLIKCGEQSVKKYSNTEKMTEDILNIIETEIKNHENDKKYKKYWTEVDYAPIKNFRLSFIPKNASY